MLKFFVKYIRESKSTPTHGDTAPTSAPTVRYGPDHLTWKCIALRYQGTENLTCRFIQLRKENGKLFTGRKYSAQAGWEYILQQMRQEFPTIMADVHYRVLKKKWSNLLQQYKELRNPVHGDRNKADDVSWPFYGALDEVLGSDKRRASSTTTDEYIDPHEFLCVSVTPEEVSTPVTTSDALPAIANEEAKGQVASSSMQQQQKSHSTNEDRTIEIERIPRVGGVTSGQVKNQGRKKRDYCKDTLLPRLPGGTELSIERIVSKSSRYADADGTNFQTNESTIATTRNRNEATNGNHEYEERPKKLRRSYQSHEDGGDRVARIDRQLEQFFEYTRRRDEENRSIMIRILHAMEIIANKL